MLVRFLDALPSDAVRTCPLEELSLMDPTLDLLLKDVGSIVSSLSLVSDLVFYRLFELLVTVFFVDYQSFYSAEFLCR